ncbi:MAG: hypothetical protein ACUZ8N_10850 [Candidatus Scalindua sp.]
MIDKVKQGKANRAKGMRFELKVRKDLESKGWIVDKWTNNVDLDWCEPYGKLHPAKSNRFNLRSTGFPDFIAFKKMTKSSEDAPGYFDLMGVEVKTNGYLSKQEKEKCSWYLENNIFSKILIASKDGKEIVYKEFERGLKNEN